MVDDYVSLDLETTGLNSKYDKIIEIGAVKVKKNVVIDTFSMFVKPGKKLSETIINLTGITDEMLLDATEPEEAIKQLFHFLEDYILLGHNILFDFSFVKRYAINYGYIYEAEAIDTLKIARTYLTDLSSKNLSSLCQYFGIESQAHRAKEDALATEQLYKILKEKYYSQDLEKELHQRVFVPQKLVYQVKKENPATKKQKEYLARILQYYKIVVDYDIERITRNEASRYTDVIISTYGKMPRDKSL